MTRALRRAAVSLQSRRVLVAMIWVERVHPLPLLCSVRVPLRLPLHLRMHLKEPPDSSETLHFYVLLQPHALFTAAIHTSRPPVDVGALSRRLFAASCCRNVAMAQAPPPGAGEAEWKNQLNLPPKDTRIRTEVRHQTAAGLPTLIALRNPAKSHGRGT